MNKDVDALKTAMDNLFKEYGVESYILSFEMNGKWYQIMKAPIEKED